MPNFDLNIINRPKENRNKSININGIIKGYDIEGKVIEDLEGEIWKSHPDYSNYQISNKGRIKNIIYNTLMSLCNDKDGYLILGLRNTTKRTTCKVHRLFAYLFCDNPNNFTTVNHINHIKSDNRAENLEWCSLKDNVIMQDHKLSPLAKSIIYISASGETKEFESITEIANYLNVSRAQIRYRLNNPIVERVKVNWLKGGTIKYK